MSLTHPVLGLMGLKQSGKDTFAARLVAEHGFTRFAFADILKDAALGIDPWIPLDNDLPALGVYRLSEIIDSHGWDAAKEEIPEVRRFLQAMGVSLREHLDADVWTRPVYEKIVATPGPVVVTDVRFPNEYDLISSFHRGYLIRIVRPGCESDGHVSEIMADDPVNYMAHYTVENRNGLDRLHALADAVARTL